MKINIRTILLALLAAAAIIVGATQTTVDNQIVDMGYKLVDTFFPASATPVDPSTTTPIVSPTAPIAD